MTAFRLRRLSRPRALLTGVLIAACMATLVSGALASGTSHRHIPMASIAAASRSLHSADATLAIKTKALKRCRKTHLDHCSSQLRALRLARRRLLSTRARFARFGLSWYRYGNLAAPTITVSGQTLTWNRIGNVTSYVLVSKVPGKADAYSDVAGTSITPGVVPGTTVRYSVRSNVNGSNWAREVSITYPMATLSTPSAPAGSAPPVETSAPASSVPTEPLVPAQSPAPAGISETPAPVQSPTLAETPAPAAEPPASPSPTSMWISLNTGNWGNEYADVAGAVNTVRTEETNISGWTEVGVKAIYDDSGPYNSGGVKALNVNEWVANAVAYVKANPEVAAVEVLNEPSGSWFWGANADSPENAAAYARLVEAVHTAFVKEFGSARPLILASYGGPAEAPIWGERVWASDPNIGDYCDGVVMHPYPSSGRGEASRQQVEEAHAKTGKPVYVTEVGWNTSVVTEAEQAQDITNFIDWAKSTGYVADVDVFNYRDYGPSAPSENWGIETWEGRHKLAYAALAAFLH